MNEDCHRDDSAGFGWCRGKGPHPRSIEAAIIKEPAYGRECRLPNGIYRTFATPGICSPLRVMFRAKKMQRHIWLIAYDPTVVPGTDVK